MSKRGFQAFLLGVVFSLGASAGAFGGQQMAEPERPGPRPSAGGVVVLRPDCLRWAVSKPTVDQFVPSESTASPYFVLRKDRNSLDKWAVVCDTSADLPTGAVVPTNLVWSSADAENSRDWVVKEVSYAVQMAVRNGAIDGLLQQQAVKEMQARFKETLDRLERRIAELEAKSAKVPTKAPAAAAKTPPVKVP